MRPQRPTAPALSDRCTAVEARATGPPLSSEDQSITPRQRGGVGLRAGCGAPVDLTASAQSGLYFSMGYGMAQPVGLTANRR